MLVVIAALAAGCVHRLDRKLGPSLQTVDQRAPFLEVHMRDGDVYVLTRWQLDAPGQLLTGDGEHRGLDRELIAAGPQTIQLADVALFETNTVETSPGVTALAVVTVASLAVTAACIANPKACFGSCPTFYAPDDRDGRSVLQAEGFSDAIAPALEHHDIDALWRTTGRGGRFVLTMTNEAYETHVVKEADLLVVPRPPGGRVLATEDRLWLAPSLAAPEACTASEGDCLARVRALDGSERTSTTDPDDLATRETIDLAFPAVAGRTGVVIGARQSLVTTFLLYQGLAYLGTTAGSWLAALDRGNPLAKAGGRALERLIGGIEVQLEQDGEWRTVGELHETGPLATDVHLVLLPPGTTGQHVRLRMPQGGWRIDYVALARIAGEATPVRIAPSHLRGTLGREYAGHRIPATNFPIVTLPGDSYELAYDLPPGHDYELFLDSRGYYLEWMRAEWLREERPLAALRMLADPDGALRELAPAFKRVEAGAEQMFWRSRYARP
ncbi:MAG: hypothetical protein ACM31C_10855 [Acidobacteriota bacterium]